MEDRLCFAFRAGPEAWQTDPRRSWRGWFPNRKPPVSTRYGAAALKQSIIERQTPSPRYTSNRERTFGFSVTVQGNSRVFVAVGRLVHAGFDVERGGRGDGRFCWPRPDDAASQVGDPLGPDPQLFPLLRPRALLFKHERDGGRDAWRAWVER
jgi:hypothetical protein